MLQQTRLLKIQALLGQYRQLNNEQLMDALNVSRETIRRDIIKLTTQGLAARVHGGIVALDAPAEPPLIIRQGARTQEKIHIAKQCAQLIAPEQTIFIDAGSTTSHLAEQLKASMNLTIITNSLQVALTLNHGQNPTQNEVILLGGNMFSGANETRGEETINAIYRYHADVAIVSPVGISSGGISSYYQWESAIAQAMFAQSKHHIVLADHSKVGKVSRFIYAPLAKVDKLVTNKSASNAVLLEKIAQQGVDVYSA
ncbi:DeoR/GlpR family DNA-binding transcription regulator [Celerinatantimonas sp. MCCC 1A17872]|uniref:DeoR/GlpR family DNA-binding transcription regulator n=1 Tax=Celerinatantimonas sp. MCCC 1A17872 TaxID=3177514 RepID=UPI0038C9F86C